MAKTRPNQTRGLRPWEPGQSGNPAGRPPDIVGRALKTLTRQDLSDLANVILAGEMRDLRRIAKDPAQPALKALIAQSLLGAYDRREFTTIDRILDRLVGRSRDAAMFGDTEPPQASAKKTFKDFCVTAGYAVPYEKQIQMMEFGINGTGPRLLLGSRGYGKTDYITIMGIAYDIYLNGTEISWLIITKSKIRNTAIIGEIATALKANGVVLGKENGACLRVAGRVGKDHSVEAITIKSSFRGRHPDKIAMDDPVDEEDVSEATRNLAQRKYNEAWKLCSNLIIIGQPVHKYDLYETLRPALKKMEVPFGTIPELDPDLAAARMAGVSEDSIQRSYYLKMVSDVANPFDKVKYVEKFPEIPVGIHPLAFIDPSFEGGDYTAISICMAHFTGYVVQGHAWKKAWHLLLDEFAALCKRYSIKRVCFETNALGDQPVELLRKKLLGVGVDGWKSTSHKHSRILALGVFAESIFLSRTSDRAYIDQVVKYELGAKHDDAPDSLASLFGWMGLTRGKRA